MTGGRRICKCVGSKSTFRCYLGEYQATVSAVVSLANTVVCSSLRCRFTTLFYLSANTANTWKPGAMKSLNLFCLKVLLLYFADSDKS